MVPDEPKPACAAEKPRGGAGSDCDAYKIPEAAQRLGGVCTKTIERWCRRGVLRSVKRGRMVLIPRSAIDEFLAKAE